uniref:Retrovirus-related Pol polyprotein from transposon TNT 1-94 n=1 Tax=Tanacetum cinerariifolium TaxID=118510 RepID=A0A699GTH5_TANCI|nr:retrovirus-related Pol polyprotein from transposon TNT 1-94 [Tanacetum cinerariifolium]
MTIGQRKPENQWTRDERKAANLDQRLKSLIMFVLPDDQMNSIINCSTAKSTWDDLIQYHEGPSNVKESRVMDLKLCYTTFKFKKGESLTQTFTKYKALMNELVNDGIKLSKLEITTGFINGLPKKWLSFCQSLRNTNNVKDSELASLFGSAVQKQLTKLNVINVARKYKPKLRPTKDFEAKYNKVKAKLALLSSSSSASKAYIVKNKGLIDEAYEWDKEEVSLDDNKMVEVKVLMALAEENDVVSKEGTRNGEWVKISIRKVHTLLEMEDNDDRKVCLDYLCIDLNYVKEQRSNLLSKHRYFVHELNACKEQLLVLKQAKLDFLTTQHVNTKIFKENKTLRTELKELKAITETWLNSSNKVNQCISEQIPSQKKRILGVDQLTEDPSSSGLKDLVFVKSLADDTKVTIPGVERSWLSEAKGFIMPNHDTGRILPSELQRNTTDSSVAVTDSLAIDYDSANESSVCSIPLPLLKKLDGVEPISGPKTIKLILRSKSTSKAKALNDVQINELSSAPAKGNKSSSASKVHSYPAESSTLEDNKLKKPITSHFPKAIKFSKPSVDNINIVESERYPSDEYLHPYEPSQRGHFTIKYYNPKSTLTCSINGAGMITRAMAKQLSVALAHECLFVDLLSKEEPKKVSEALKHPGWLDAILKAIRIFLAFATYMNFIVYQMDVKSAFLNAQNFANKQWELSAEFLDLPHLASLVQEKLKTLDSLPSLLKTVTNTLNMFATLVENESGATTTGVPSADKITASPAEGEKDDDTNLKNELVDLLGIDIVTRYYNKKLLYERYCEKMKKRRQSSKIINCDVLTKKGPISLKVYREDRTAEVIEKFKAKDLQLAE